MLKAAPEIGGRTTEKARRMLPERAYETERPRSTHVSSVRVGDWLLTNAVWENSLGSYQLETGIRYMNQIEATGRPRFELIQHDWSNFDAANDVIIKALRKQWRPYRISAFMENLKDRRRTHATIL
jgi:hypothetical protein